MLKSKIEIMFYPNNTITQGIFSYSADYMRSVTFRFGKDDFFIGFIERNIDIKEYIFDEKYLLVILFPSIDFAFYNKYKTIWEKNGEIGICSGKKNIGIGKMRSWEFIEG